MPTYCEKHQVFHQYQTTFHGDRWFCPKCKPGLVCSLRNRLDQIVRENERWIEDARSNKATNS